MDTVVCRLTVFFEDPFWVGVYERTSRSGLEAARVVFGDEPKDYEVYDFFLNQWADLEFSPPVAGGSTDDRKINPKRMQRAAQKAVSGSGVGTKAQEALKLQYEQNKAEHKSEARRQTEEEKERQFEIRQQKRKEKHRGH
jgi:hypothetical protein